MKLINRLRGCLLGGAIGDALGAPVEFLTVVAIRNKYGLKGIQDFHKAYSVMGSITDDTQMTLFTEFARGSPAPCTRLAALQLVGGEVYESSQSLLYKKARHSAKRSNGQNDRCKGYRNPASVLQVGRLEEP